MKEYKGGIEMGVLNFVTVEGILDTFESLSEREKRQIAFLVKQQRMDFGNEYCYICKLVEEFQVPPYERRALRLDTSVFGENSVQECVGTADSNLERLFQEETEEGFLTTEQIFAILEGQLSQEDVELLRSLDGGTKSMLNFSSKEEVLDLVPEIQRRLKQIRESRYFRNGKLVPLPIKEVEFSDDGVLIDFGSRNWEVNDPLDFFRQHQNVYDGISRSELYDFDPGLYDALRERGQLEEAIPERINCLSQEVFEKLCKAHELGMSQSKAAEYTGVAPSTVFRVWKKMGLKPHFNKPALLTAEKIKKIFEAYELNMSMEEAALYADVSSSSIWKHWTRTGKKSHHACKPLPIERIEKILEGHQLGMSMSKTATYADVAYSSVVKYWEKAGLEPRYKKGGALKEKVEMVSAAELAHYLRLNILTVHRLAKRGKLPGIKIGKEWKFDKKKVDQLFSTSARTPCE